MPKPDVLTEVMWVFVFRHPLPLDTGLDFHQHADRMIAAITSLMPGAVADDEANPPKAPGVRGGSRRQFAVLTISAMIVAGLMAAGWFYWNRVAKNKLATSPPPAVAH